MPLSAEPVQEASNTHITQLSERIDALEADLAEERAKRKNVEKEQEDLLVLLDELNAKRRSDKAKMRENGMEVSEDEDAEDEDANESEGEGED